MRKRDLTTEELDRIGLKTLAALRASDDEIDRMVGREDLFEPVRAAIRVRPVPPSTRLPYLRWPLVLGWGMAAATLLVVAMVGVVAFVGQYDTSRQEAENLSEQVLPVGLPPTRVPSPLLGDREPAGSAIAAAVGLERQASRSNRRSHRIRTEARPERTNTEDIGEFQAITYAGDTSEIDDVGQIVRVELPRSSLYALGVDLPIENQAATKIKADLLIGDDGVMRAVRVVN